MIAPSTVKVELTVRLFHESYFLDYTKEIELGFVPTPGIEFMTGVGKLQSSPAERVRVDYYDDCIAVRLQDVPMESDDAMDKSAVDMKLFGWEPS